MLASIYLLGTISKMDEGLRKVLDRLETMCSKREYCRKDILAKALKLVEGDQSAAGELLDSLVENRYVDDGRYAGAFAREKAQLDGWGPLKIRYALRAKGIEPALIDDALGTIDSEVSVQRLDKLLQAKARSLEGDPQKKPKLIKFALSRGYEYDQVRDHISLY